MLTTHRGAVISCSTPTRLSTKPWKLPAVQVRLFGFVLNSFFTLRCLLERRPVACCCCLSTAASPVCVKAHRRAANEPSPICADVSWLLAPSPQVLPPNGGHSPLSQPQIWTNSTMSAWWMHRRPQREKAYSHLQRGINDNRNTMCSVAGSGWVAPQIALHMMKTSQSEMFGDGCKRRDQSTQMLFLSSLHSC